MTVVAEWIDTLSWTTKYCDYEFRLTKSRYSTTGEEIFEAILTYPNGETEVEDLIETFEAAHEALNDMIVKELGETKVRVQFKEDKHDDHEYGDCVVDRIPCKVNWVNPEFMAHSCECCTRDGGMVTDNNPDGEDNYVPYPEMKGEEP